MCATKGYGRIIAFAVQPEVFVVSSIHATWSFAFGSKDSQKRLCSDYITRCARKQAVAEIYLEQGIDIALKELNIRKDRETKANALNSRATQGI